MLHKNKKKDKNVSSLYWEYHAGNEEIGGYITCPNCGYKVDARRFFIQTGNKDGFATCPQCGKDISSEKIDYDELIDAAIAQQETRDEQQNVF